MIHIELYVRKKHLIVLIAVILVAAGIYWLIFRQDRVIRTSEFGAYQRMLNEVGEYIYQPGYLYSSPLIKNADDAVRLAVLYEENYQLTKHYYTDTTIQYPEDPERRWKLEPRLVTYDEKERCWYVLMTVDPMWRERNREWAERSGMENFWLSTVYIAVYDADGRTVHYRDLTVPMLDG